MTTILSNTLFVSGYHREIVSNFFTNYGVMATFLQSFTLIPFKIWTNTAVQQNLNYFVYILLVAVSRIVRFAIIVFVFSWIGKKFNKQIRNHFIPAVLLFIIGFFSLVFVWET